MKIQKDIKVVENRIIDTSIYDEKDKKINRFKELDQELKALGKKDILNKIQVIKILTEIHDELLYLMAGFRNFGAYAKSCFISESTAYMFVKIGQKLKDGSIIEQDIVKYGVAHIRDIIQNKDYGALRTGEGVAKNTPLRILLPSDDAYSYFKSNTKFTSYLLKTLYNENRQLLDAVFFRYDQEKKKRKHHVEDIIEEGAEEQQVIEGETLE
ncbi:chromosome replication/partitioning protein [Candidatus Borreliella tachyglossi]|uniref:chromosome replication/partitioning protein n=1 Tax=Candidatus Borreliella tachyglossi TaxID=1964448 RepID=UPI00404139C8